MIQHYRTYHDVTCGCADCLIGYSAGGYEVAPHRRTEYAESQDNGSHTAAYLRQMAAAGQPFTVREFTQRFGVQSIRTSLYATLQRLVAAGVLVRRTGPHNVSIYQGTEAP